MNLGGPPLLDMRAGTGVAAVATLGYGGLLLAPPVLGTGLAQGGKRRS